MAKRKTTTTQARPEVKHLMRMVRKECMDRSINHLKLMEESGVSHYTAMGVLSGTHKILMRKTFEALTGWLQWSRENHPNPDAQIDLPLEPEPKLDAEKAKRRRRPKAKTVSTVEISEHELNELRAELQWEKTRLQRTRQAYLDEQGNLEAFRREIVDLKVTVCELAKSLVKLQLEELRRATREAE